MAKKNTTTKLKVVTAPTDATPTKKAKAGKPAKTKPAAEAKAKKPSAINAAAKVLGENGQPMNCKEMIEAMAAKKYWTSPAGARSTCSAAGRSPGRERPGRSDGYEILMQGSSRFWLHVASHF